MCPQPAPDPTTAGGGFAPVPERRPVELVTHGDVRVDDWFWLRDKDDPAVIDRLKAENAHTEAAMAGTAGLQATLFDEIVARIEETDVSVPVRKGPWLYYSRTVEGSSYGIHCRRSADLGPTGDGVAPRVWSSPPGRSPQGSRYSSTRTCWPRVTSTSRWGPSS